MHDRKMSIIVPLYNEERTIVVMLEKLFEVSLPGIEKEVIVVDDCSSDGSAGALRQFADAHPEHCLIIVTLVANYGKGYAIRRGLQEVSGDFVMIQDADLDRLRIYTQRLQLPVRADPERECRCCLRIKVYRGQASPGSVFLALYRQ